MGHDEYRDALHDLTTALLDGDAVRALEIYQRVADEYGTPEAGYLADEARLEVRLLAD